MVVKAAGFTRSRYRSTIKFNTNKTELQLLENEADRSTRSLTSANPNDYCIKKIFLKSQKSNTDESINISKQVRDLQGIHTFTIMSIAAMRL